MLPRCNVSQIKKERHNVHTNRFGSYDDIVINFNEITNTEHVYFRDAVKIYSESFPSNERHSLEVIKKRVTNKSYRMFIGHLNNEAVFMALFWYLKNSNFILLDYMAVKEKYRNKGIGGRFVKNVFSILEEKNKYFILEVENPKYGDNREQRKRRVKFYKRLGAMEMKNTRYILPALSGGEPTEMLLMVFPKYTGGKISGKLVKSIILQIYREVYNRNEDDRLLNTFIHTIPDVVILI